MIGKDENQAHYTGYKEPGGISQASAEQQAALYGTHQETIDKLLKENRRLAKENQAWNDIIELTDEIRLKRIEEKLDKLIAWVETARKAKGEA